MRIVLMGTGPFAVPSFEAIRALEKHEILKVVTRPTQNSDAKSKTLANPVRAWADQHRLPLVDPASINEANSIEALTRLDADLLVVCDYGQILSIAALKAARLGGINLHGSLLPRHRGAAPVQWAILRGDKTTGVCVIHMTPKLDGGPIIACVSTSIGPCETAGELEKRLSELGIACCLEAIDKLSACATLEDCEGMGEAQLSALATSAPRLAKSDGQLDFRYPAALIERQVRGLQPWPGAFAMIKVGESKELRVLVHEAKITNFSVDSLVKVDQSLPTGIATQKAAAGEMFWGQTMRERKLQFTEPELRSSDDFPSLMVACVDFFVSITRLQPAGKRVMEAREFIAGYGRASSMNFEPLDVERIDVERKHPLLEKMMNYNH